MHASIQPDVAYYDVPKEDRTPFSTTFTRSLESSNLNPTMVSLDYPDSVHYLPSPLRSTEYVTSVVVVVAGDAGAGDAADHWAVLGRIGLGEGTEGCSGLQNPSAFTPCIGVKTDD